MRIHAYTQGTSVYSLIRRTKLSKALVCHTYQFTLLTMAIFTSNTNARYEGEKQHALHDRLQQNKSLCLQISQSHHVEPHSVLANEAFKREEFSGEAIMYRHYSPRIIDCQKYILPVHDCFPWKFCDWHKLANFWSFFSATPPFFSHTINISNDQTFILDSWMLSVEEEAEVSLPHPPTPPTVYNLRGIQAAFKQVRATLSLSLMHI